MTVKVDISPEVWQPVARWIRQSQETEAARDPGPSYSLVFPAPQPFSTPEARVGVEQLLKKSNRLDQRKVLTLNLSWKAAIALMRQFESWGNGFHPDCPPPPPEGRGILRTVERELEIGISLAEEKKASARSSRRG